ncbi:MAG: hypothetical protein Q3982_08620 [Phoenicibacter congonensis]|uniref:Uncharacterized protein n=1 Tax=Phoenicibacter congonensis TaxID=1944646 RepID=A0AA43RKZ5_9ACTN|nr:hypothetical protein [Phoenicibacter congonensis]
MADLFLRLGQDVLTVAENARSALISAGLDIDAEAAVTLNVEPEVVDAEIRNDIATGAQCIVANVFSFCPSALRKMRALHEAENLAKLTMLSVENRHIQHPLIRVLPSDLPLDPTSKTSLNEHCEEYKFVANLFEKFDVDGFLLHGFESETELKCAMIGLRKASNKTIVYDKSQFEGTDIIDEDYEPASSKLAVIDYEKLDHIDHLLDVATEKANSGAQFLLVTNGNPSKTAAVCALTKGLQVQA